MFKAMDFLTYRCDYTLSHPERLSAASSGPRRALMRSRKAPRRGRTPQQGRPSTLIPIQADLYRVVVPTPDPDEGRPRRLHFPIKVPMT
jgi:hypothetical protein